MSVMLEINLGLITKRRCDLVLLDYRNGVTDKEQAIRRIMGIESAMYDEYPNAEPDGDITYMAATAREELEQPNPNPQRLQHRAD